MEQSVLQLGDALHQKVTINGQPLPAKSKLFHAAKSKRCVQARRRSFSFESESKEPNPLFGKISSHTCTREVRCEPTVIYHSATNVKAMLSGGRSKTSSVNVKETVQLSTNRNPRKIKQVKKVASSQATKHDSKPVKLAGYALWNDTKTVSYCTTNKIMYVLRGLPGSGKSTLGQSIAQLYSSSSVVICSADNFRYNANGEYLWNPHDLEKTHELCQQKAFNECRKGCHVLVIDNTNIKHWHMQPYFSMAWRFNYPVVLLEPCSARTASTADLAARNKHAVPEKTIMKMKEDFETVIAYYYGWILSTSDASFVKRKFHGIINGWSSCPAFRESSLYEAMAGGRLMQLYTLREASSPQQMLHVTACFTGEGRHAYQRNYGTDDHVLSSLGGVSSLSIIGWCVTPNSLIARVKLTEEQIMLWGRDDSLLEDCAPRAVERMPCNGSSAFPRRASDNAGKVDAFLRLLPRFTIAPSFRTSCTAHITLGVREGFKAMQAGIDLNELLQLELNSAPDVEFKVGRSLLRCYRDSWVVYLCKAILVPSMFGGFYR